ncbi:MAG TPA: excalibur calcium-binding domain-containing protein [Actinokineospora sp.]|nr:excalibur calcium-binding domain-containing protein [Actinokineospora sp.]
MNEVSEWWRTRKRKPLWIAGGVVLLLLLLSAVFGDPDDTKRPQGLVGGASTSSATSSASEPGHAAIPEDLIGKGLPDAKKQLNALGFHDVVVKSVDGRSIIVEANWLVSRVDGLGTSVPLTTPVTVWVDKPKSTAEPAEPLPSPADVPPPPPADDTTAAAPEPIPEPEAPAAYYPNCAAADAAGVTPLRAGEPGYRKGLDRDGDGVACDK